MSQEMGALPGTIRTASVVLTLDGLSASATGLATVSLANVRFNEVDAPAVFSLLLLHVGRDSDVRVELSSMADTIEDWPRWTVRREFTVQVWNLGNAALVARQIPLLLSGFPPAPIPKTSKFTRQAALPVPNTSSIASAKNALGLPLDCQWLPLPA